MMKLREYSYEAVMRLKVKRIRTTSGLVSHSAISVASVQVGH